MPLGVCLLALFFISNPAQSQDFRAVLTGQVTDPSGAVIPKAKITATSVSSGTTYTATSTGAGVYYIPYILPGHYRVTATASGFKTLVQDKVTLFASETFNQNFKLEVGSVAERVVVTAAPTQLETSSGSGGTIIGQRELLRSGPLWSRERQR